LCELATEHVQRGPQLLLGYVLGVVSVTARLT
jgi:hypothetical protein